MGLWNKLDVAREVGEVGGERFSWCVFTMPSWMDWLSLLRTNLLWGSLLLCMQEMWPLFQCTYTQWVRILGVCLKYEDPKNWKQWIIFLKKMKDDEKNQITS